MPQAMERLLASPKTTAVLPARLIMLSVFLQVTELEQGQYGEAALLSEYQSRL